MVCGVKETGVSTQKTKTEQCTRGGGRFVSVIVPVYKVELYLRPCIDSILSQTFTDFELILVDDGSPDNCGAICDEYAEKDARIVVIHQENQGVSAARNAALDWCFANSSSQWITFVDSDDVIVSDYLEILLKYAQETGVDVVTTNAYHFENDAELQHQLSSVASWLTMRGRDACISFYRDEGVVLPQPWGKLCKKELLHNLRFPIGITYAEDEYLVVRMIYVANHVAALSARIYGYRIREDGANHQTFSKWAVDFSEVLESSIAFFEEHNEWEIVLLAKEKSKVICAKNMLMAYGSGKLDTIPDKYKMSMWRAFLITMAHTLRVGGWKYVMVRIRLFMKRIKR